MILRVEGLPLPLEDSPTDSLVLDDTFCLKLAAASLTAGHEICRIHLILSHVELLLLIDVHNALFLQLLQLVASSLHLLWVLRQWHWHGGLPLSKVGLGGWLFLVSGTLDFGALALAVNGVDFGPGRGVVAAPKTMFLMGVSSDLHAPL